MFFNTKTSKQISPNSYRNDNKFIPISRSTEEGEQEGRQVYYETIVVTTPVLASTRIHDSESPKRLLNKSQVDELNDLLNSLYLGDSSATTPTKKEGPPVKSQDHETNSDDQVVLGRREQSIFDAKTKSHRTVWRSARLFAFY